MIDDMGRKTGNQVALARLLFVESPRVVFADGEDNASSYTCK